MYTGFISNIFKLILYFVKRGLIKFWFVLYCAHVRLCEILPRFIDVSSKTFMLHKDVKESQPEAIGLVLPMRQPVLFSKLHALIKKIMKFQIYLLCGVKVS